MSVKEEKERTNLYDVKLCFFIVITLIISIIFVASENWTMSLTMITITIILFIILLCLTARMDHLEDVEIDWI